MSKFKLNPPSVSPYTEKLMLQLLLEHRGFSEVFHEDVWRYDNIAEALGLPSEMERCDDFRAKVKKLLQARNCHHCHGLAAGGFQMLFHHQHRRTLHLVLGVDRSRIAHGICRNHHQVIFLVRVVLDAAVYAAGTESLCGTNAAVHEGIAFHCYFFHEV